MKKDNRQMSWREAMSINQRAFKIFFKQYPQMVVSRFISVIWNALTPYVGIYLSALVIDELAGDRDPNRLKLFVSLTLAFDVVIALVTALLIKWKETHNAGLWYKVDNILIQKLLNMDYVSCDDTHTADLLYKIYQNQQGGGWGFYRVIGQYESLCTSILTILGGITLTVSLFASKVPDIAGDYTVLNNQLFVFFLIALMLAVTFIAPALSNKAGSYWAKHADSHNLGNRLFGFFGWLGYKKDIATDVRMYAQEI